MTAPRIFCAAGSRLPAAGQQCGVALVIALVVLAVIGLTSVAVMRGALNADLLANHARIQGFASQAAQLALRYCESELLKKVPAIAVLDASPLGTPGQWEDFGQWFPEGGGAQTVPDAWLKTADSSMSDSQRSPQCLAEHSTLGGSSYIVTARGFSPDYSEDAKGRTQTGSVVWVQSQLLLGS